MYSGRPTAVVHPTARKRIRVRGRIAPPPGVATAISNRLNVTVVDPATSGDVGGRPALTRARSVTVICSGIVSVEASGNHVSVTDDGNGCATRKVPSAAAGCDEVDSSGRPLESRSNFTGPPGVRPEAFGLTASSSDRHGRTGASETAAEAGMADAPSAAVTTMDAAAARRSGVDRMMAPSRGKRAVVSASFLHSRHRCKRARAMAARPWGGVARARYPGFVVMAQIATA